MALPPLDEETKDAFLAKIGLNRDKLKEAVRVLKEWLNQQPHLPSEFEDCRLERWITDCTNNIERTKSCLDMYLSLKNIVPEFLTDRDPDGHWFENATSVAFAVPLPSLTPDYTRVTVLGPLHQDPSNFNMMEICKLAFLIQDVRKWEDFRLCNVYIIDLANFSTGFLTKFSLPLVKKFMYYHKECFPEKITAIHIINTPKSMEIIMGIAKILLNPKLFGRMYIHSKGYETLHEHVPKKILPNEYGGNAGPLTELQSSWYKHLKTYRSWLLDQDKFKSDETKRLSRSINREDMFGLEGSFRQMSID